MSKYDIAKVRKKLQEKQGDRFKDPNEFKPPKAADGEVIKYRFFVLPPLKAGDTCADGVASKDMDLFYVPNGSHFINNRLYTCPRIHEDDECPICKIGFDLMSETDDKKRRSEIARQFLPRSQYAVNIYFPKDKVNNKDVAGKIMWMNVSKQVYDKFEACVMNDDEGDPSDPQAYGVFFDEMESYLFQLSISKKGEWNSYTDSKFLANLGKRPIATKDGKPVESRIKEILDQRFDLYTKFKPVDHDALNALAVTLRSGEPVEDTGWDEDETSNKPEPMKHMTSARTKTKARAEAPESMEVGLGEDVGEDVEDVEDTTGDAEAVTENAEPVGVTSNDKNDIEDDDLQKLLDEIEDT